MRLVPLHNVLSSTLRLLDADAAAMRLLPRGDAWQPLDVAVGDTALLQALSWSEDQSVPAPPVAPIQRAIFGLPEALKLYICEEQSCVAMQIDVSDQLLAAMPSQFKTFEKRGATREVLGSLWFALAFADREDLAGRFDYEPDTGALAELLIGVAAQALWGLYQSRQAHADPITGLPGAAEFRSRLRRPFDGADVGTTALYLLSVDGYAQQRNTFGQERAEQLLQDAARHLEMVVRKDDGLFCYREAQFAVIAQVQDHEGSRLLAEKLERALDPLRRTAGIGDISTSIGYVLATGGDDPQTLCLAAEQALDYARLRGGQTSVAYSEALPESELNQHHLASSLLTDPERGYRNNYILWQTLELIAGETAPDEVASQFGDLLQVRLGAEIVVLVEDVAGELQPLGRVDAGAEDVLTGRSRRTIAQALRRRESVRADDPVAGTGIAIPLIARHQIQGCLYIERREPLDTADDLFLCALADQVAGALDRAKLVLHHLALHERESEALREKLSDLHPQDDVVRSVQIHHSVAMRDVMDFVARIAPTDVSVLVMGESGAGKEVMARAIHAVSQRSTAPFVVVDCSAITPSLIESELFGRVKGAFTGADAASEGRIAQAHGGTLFLDEIGELPLDVQAKLLRFVQEKELVAVGATATQQIDTRIICATNRDLQAEVQEGRFRADLYFRLQAIQVKVPPLRQRVDDLPALVEHFVHDFNSRFDSRIEGLTESAWLKVRTYPWPGNVRELENVLMRAVLLVKSGRLQADDLELNEQAALPGSASLGQPPAVSSQESTVDEDPWFALASLLSDQITAVFNDGQPEGPIGRWLSELTVLSAWELNDRVVVSAARLLGVPETTLRRQLAKAQQHQDNPLTLRSPQWQAALPTLQEVLLRVMTDAQAPDALAEAIDLCLLEQIDAVVGANHAGGAALLGVTPPTYVKRLQKMGEPPSAMSSSLEVRR